MAEPLPLRGRTILIVEDAYLIALEAQRIVEEAGAERVLLAATVEDVRSTLAVEPKIDLCVLDLKLGEEDARPLISDIAARGVPVLVVTGFASTTVSSGTPVLRKPYQESDLVEAIRFAVSPEIG